MKLLAPIDDVGDLGYPKIAHITSNLTSTNTTLADATGLGVSMAANARYFVEYFITYDADQARDIKMTHTIPSGATGWWTPNCVEAGATSNGGAVGDLNGFAVVLTDVHAFSGCGAGGPGMFAGPVAYVITTNAGTLQLQWALFSTAGGAGNGTLRWGSLVRSTRIA